MHNLHRGTFISPAFVCTIMAYSEDESSDDGIIPVR